MGLDRNGSESNFPGKCPAFSSFLLLLWKEDLHQIKCLNSMLLKKSTQSLNRPHFDPNNWRSSFEILDRRGLGCGMLLIHHPERLYERGLVSLNIISKVCLPLWARCLHQILERLASFGFRQNKYKHLIFHDRWHAFQSSSKRGILIESIFQ